MLGQEANFVSDVFEPGLDSACDRALWEAPPAPAASRGRLWTGFLTCWRHEPRRCPPKFLIELLGKGDIEKLPALCGPRWLLNRASVSSPAFCSTLPRHAGEANPVRNGSGASSLNRAARGGGFLFMGRNSSEFLCWSGRDSRSSGEEEFPHRRGAEREGGQDTYNPLCGTHNLVSPARGFQDDGSGTGVKVANGGCHTAAES